jgi:hypothetical protein
LDTPALSDDTIHKEFKNLIKKTHATSLLAGRGFDILGNIQELAENL